MPRPDAPPTPLSSTEIKGKDGHTLQMSFELPPPAMTGVDSRPTSASTKSSSASSYHPTTPNSPAPAIPASESVKIRRRFSLAQPAKDAFALPPPPTRSRKIIQMKPRGQPEQAMEAVKEVGQTAAKSTPAKKKQPSSTSVAGRKIARKTAHSLIERRRRSKMNEEFGVLKDMIPACTGEMHKLAILQASIDYVRYLEDCIAKLKAENTRNASSTPALEQFHLPPPMSRSAYDASRRNSAIEDDGDVEMEGSEPISPTCATPIPNSRQPTISPAIPPQDPRRCHDSYSSTSYGYSTSATTSPNFGPVSYDYARSNASAIGSTLTSPALQPQTDRDLDQEATAALLMLNTDRRNTQGSIRGMSVKDLLSG